MGFDYKKLGKQNKAIGSDTERRARADLEKENWIVCKWRNNVKDNELIATKNYFIGGRAMLGSGFPDFMAYRLKEDEGLYEVIGVEVKSNGWLDQTEKEKCEWLLKNKIFPKILIASREKIKNKIHIEYKEFEVKQDGD